jgi:ComF family protein
MLRWRQTLFSQLEQLSLHGSCPLCERTTPDIFCQDCSRHLKKYQYPHWDMDKSLDPPLLAWGRYEGLLKQALARLKYNQKTRIAQSLGQWLGLAWLNTHPSTRRTILVPIPLHVDRWQQRGYNQSLLIAESFSHVTGLPLAKQGLVRVRATSAQFNLSRPERFCNLEQAFRLAPDFAKQTRKRSILLVDDIYTTGATATSALQTFQEAGLHVIAIAVVARADDF